MSDAEGAGLAGARLGYGGGVSANREEQEEVRLSIGWTACTGSIRLDRHLSALCKPARFCTLLQTLRAQTYDDLQTTCRKSRMYGRLEWLVSTRLRVAL